MYIYVYKTSVYVYSCKYEHYCTRYYEIVQVLMENAITKTSIMMPTFDVHLTSRKHKKTTHIRL